ncbi:hypothetical protein [Pedobacter aquatilis]|uniref:hypothetical protein n=1 Tax=Pedobacter aquatilis TaxID=351343 RepID=UPI00292FC849|nr:hypothetical protein [Pedobacter aquatilis]
MLKLTSSHLNNARTINRTAYNAIIEKMQETILSGDTIEISGEEHIVRIENSKELNDFIFKLG